MQNNGNNKCWFYLESTFAHGEKTFDHVLHALVDDAFVQDGAKPLEHG